MNIKTNAQFLRKTRKPETRANQLLDSECFRNCFLVHNNVFLTLLYIRALGIKQKYSKAPLNMIFMQEWVGVLIHPYRKAGNTDGESNITKIVSHSFTQIVHLQNIFNTLNNRITNFEGLSCLKGHTDIFLAISTYAMVGNE